MERNRKNPYKTRHEIKIKEGTELIKGNYYRTGLHKDKIIKEEISKIKKVE